MAQCLFHLLLSSSMSMFLLLLLMLSFFSHFCYDLPPGEKERERGLYNKKGVDNRLFGAVDYTRRENTP